MLKLFSYVSELGPLPRHLAAAAPDTAEGAPARREGLLALDGLQTR